MPSLRISGIVLAVASILGSDFASAQVGPGAPVGPAPGYGPRGSRRVNIFIPPIGGFGGFSADIGGGRVDINVGPSGYGPYGGPAFGGVQVEVFRPQSFYGPTVIYGPDVPPAGVVAAPRPYLGCVGDDCLPDSIPSQLAPVPEPLRDRDSATPPPPAPGKFDTRPATKTSIPNAVPETVVPKRVEPTKGPDLPQLPPQALNKNPERVFPTGGPILLPPGYIPKNGFDVDRSTVRPNAPVRPGDDPFGPSRPRPNPNDPALPAT